MINVSVIGKFDQNFYLVVLQYLRNVASLTLFVFITVNICMMHMQIVKIFRWQGKIAFVQTLLLVLYMFMN